MKQATKLEVVQSEEHPLTPPVTMDIATSRQAQEVQAAMIIAKRFPRDETAAWDRIMKACKRRTLAEVACYAYPRGGTTVTGASIRLAEALAQNWGNVDSGVIELEQKNGESTVMAFCWDLQTNARSTKIFTVKHERKAQGQIKHLDDPRDIYEMVANQGARRLRACILSIIPGDIVDAAVAECEKTIAGGSTEPLSDRARKMVSAFSEFGVIQPMIEKRIGHKIEAISEQELVNLRKVYTSLKDGAAKRDEFFDISIVAPSKPVHTVDNSNPELNPIEPTTTQPPPQPEKSFGEVVDGASPEDRVHAGLVNNVLSMAKEDGLTEVQVLTYCKQRGVKLAAQNAESLMDMVDAKLNILIENWEVVLQKIGKK